MAKSSSVMRNISSIALAWTALASAAGARTLDNQQDALTLVHQLGVAWNGTPNPVSEKAVNGAKAWRYDFSPTHFLRLEVASNGEVVRFYAYSAQQWRDKSGQSCRSFPDFQRTATVMIAATEPSHTPAQERSLAGIAKLGWTPVVISSATRIGRTNFRFSSLNGGCQIEVRR
ncbi:hypothetical protein [Sphingobium sp. BS19]|uniref:hypothetical protein n=1 Tax=Sphingobium sp. BS19 TaxID=3018973 RepID=UPI0022EFA4D8|nr:hypothetical protein [Sphingobium sp. BS19]GLI97659.1 hypothetical protein Sbs19_14770 [Sphingobium sp. BS19]